MTPNSEMLAGHWSGDAVRPIGAGDHRLPPFSAADVAPAIAGLDLWDMWPVADAAGRTVVRDGRQWWFFLAVPRGDDPEARHDHARIHLLRLGSEGWRDEGPVFADGFAPGSREWSGSSVLDDDGETITLYFTAAGDRIGGPRFRQRLFATEGRFAVDAAGRGRCSHWDAPVELVTADPRWYAPADQAEAVDGGIEGFRDPGYFRDPRDGAEYLLFTATAVGAPGPFAGVVGIARREGAAWRVLPPILDAVDTNAEMERPHIVQRGGLYYLFWSTQRRRFANSLSVAPTGLYGMVAPAIEGPWRPLNGSGLVAGNPEGAPWQAYCWWVMGEGDVLSFVDYPGATDPQAAAVPERRRRFGGTPAPFFRLRFDGDTVTIA